MAEEQATTPQQDPSRQNGGNPPGEEPDMSEIDLQALAEELFRLLKSELRIENERMGR